MATGYYDTSKKAFVTDSGRTYSTSNPNFVPRGYTAVSPPANTSTSAGGQGGAQVPETYSPEEWKIKAAVERAENDARSSGKVGVLSQSEIARNAGVRLTPENQAFLQSELEDRGFDVQGSTVVTPERFATTTRPEPLSPEEERVGRLPSGNLFRVSESSQRVRDLAESKLPQEERDLMVNKGKMPVVDVNPEELDAAETEQGTPKAPTTETPSPFMASALDQGLSGTFYPQQGIFVNEQGQGQSMANAPFGASISNQSIDINNPAGSEKLSQIDLVEPKGFSYLESSKGPIFAEAASDQSAGSKTDVFDRLDRTWAQAGQNLNQGITGFAPLTNLAYKGAVIVEDAIFKNEGKTVKGMTQAKIASQIWLGEESERSYQKAIKAPQPSIKALGYNVLGTAEKGVGGFVNVATNPVETMSMAGAFNVVGKTFPGTSSYGGPLIAAFTVYNIVEEQKGQEMTYSNPKTGESTKYTLPKTQEPIYSGIGKTAGETGAFLSYNALYEASPINIQGGDFSPVVKTGQPPGGPPSATQYETITLYKGISLHQKGVGEKPLVSWVKGAKNLRLGSNIKLTENYPLESVKVLGSSETQIPQTRASGKFVMENLEKLYPNSPPEQFDYLRTGYDFAIFAEGKKAQYRNPNALLATKAGTPAERIGQAGTVAEQGGVIFGGAASAYGGAPKGPGYRGAEGSLDATSDWDVYFAGVKLPDVLAAKTAAQAKSFSYGGGRPVRILNPETGVADYYVGGAYTGSKSMSIKSMQTDRTAFEVQVPKTPENPTGWKKSTESKAPGISAGDEVPQEVFGFKLEPSTDVVKEKSFGFKKPAKIATQESEYYRKIAGNVIPAEPGKIGAVHEGRLKDIPDLYWVAQQRLGSQLKEGQISGPEYNYWTARWAESRAGMEKIGTDFGPKADIGTTPVSPKPSPKLRIDTGFPLSIWSTGDYLATRGKSSPKVQPASQSLVFLPEPPSPVRPSPIYTSPVISPLLYGYTSPEPSPSPIPPSPSPSPPYRYYPSPSPSPEPPSPDTYNYNYDYTYNYDYGYDYDYSFKQKPTGFYIPGGDFSLEQGPGGTPGQAKIKRKYQYTPDLIALALGQRTAVKPEMRLYGGEERRYIYDPNYKPSQPRVPRITKNTGMFRLMPSVKGKRKITTRKLKQSSFRNPIRVKLPKFNLRRL
jgi:hypothetical protein